MVFNNYKKGEIPVINYEGPNDVFVWKHPEEDFYTGAQLIVHESQEALFFRNGQALDLFPSGRHVLETENLPLLNRILKKPLDGITPFHAEVYYINKVVSMEILWGTAQPLLIQDPKYQIILPVRANGQFAIRVVDSRKLLVKLVGTINNFNKETLLSYFKGLLMTRITDCIAKKMVNDQITFLQIATHLNEISDSIRDQIRPEFDEYGLELVNFYTNNISIPEDNEDYRALKRALTGSTETKIRAEAKRAEMDMMGYTYQQQRAFDVMERAASNEGSSANVMNAGMGMGMGMGMGGMMGGAMGQMGSAMMGVNMMQQGGPGQYGGIVMGPNGQPMGYYGQQMPNQGMPGQGMAGQQMQPQAQPEAQAAAAAPAAAPGRVCSKCGNPLPEGAKFCLECGTKVEEAIPEGMMICPECGELTPQGKFCCNCGHPLAPAAPKKLFCPECGKEMPAGSKFCFECGHKF